MCECCEDRPGGRCSREGGLDHFQFGLILDAWLVGWLANSGE